MVSMLDEDGKPGGRRSPQHHRRASKGQRPAPSPNSLFLPLFGGLRFGPGPRSSTSNRSEHEPERERQRDRDHDRARTRDARDRNRTRVRDKDKDRDHDRDWNRDRQHHPHHRPRNRSTPQPPRAPLPPKLVEVVIKSLDHRHANHIFGVRPGFQVMKFEQVIRDRAEERRRPINPTTLFRFYSHDGTELQQQDVIEPGCPPIWYRMSTPVDEVKDCRFRPWDDNTRWRFDTEFTAELGREIDAGATVGKIRRKIAHHRNIGDPNRVVLIARGGLLQGSLKGESWELQQVKKKWLCRWIAVDVYPENRYFILKGLQREYVCHPDRSDYRKGMLVSDLKHYLATKLFNSARHYGKSRVELGWRHISLKRNGINPGDRTRAYWGATYTFELPIDAAEMFSDEETWLLPATETCSVCIEDKKMGEMPIKVTSGCQHPSTTCKGCVQQWLQSGLESGTWDKLKCPECSEVLKHADVKRYASNDTFARYDALITRAALDGIPNFQWCLSTTCESGQIQEEKCPRFKCESKNCGARYCVVHNVPWHKGETCEEYDRRNQQRKRDDKASEDMINKTSKKCPECKKAVHKWSGCNHITCVCKHEWCYICFAKFERNHVGFLFCRHNPGCTERDPFIDLIDNPIGQQQQQARRAGVPGARPGHGNWGNWGANPVFPPPLRARPAGVGGAPMRHPLRPPPRQNQGGLGAGIPAAFNQQFRAGMGGADEVLINAVAQARRAAAAGRAVQQQQQQRIQDAQDVIRGLGNAARRGNPDQFADQLRQVQQLAEEVDERVRRMHIIPQ